MTIESGGTYSGFTPRIRKTKRIGSQSSARLRVPDGKGRSCSHFSERLPERERARSAAAFFAAGFAVIGALGRAGADL